CCRIENKIAAGRSISEPSRGSYSGGKEEIQMNILSKKAVLFFSFFAASAFAKGPWFDGTYSGINPLYPDQSITIEFQQNEPKALVMPPFNTRITDLKPTYGAYYNEDQSMEVKLKSDSAGAEFRLVGGIGEAKTALLYLQNGAVVTLKKN